MPDFEKFIETIKSNKGKLKYGYDEARVVEEAEVVRGRFRHLKSAKCPLCGADIILSVHSIRRYDDDTIWVLCEETCENPKCTHDKILEVKIFPRYPCLEVEYY